MTLLKLDAVVTKIYTLLSQDDRTKDVNWYNGRRSPIQRKRIPAGDVYLGPGSVRAYTIPKGEDAPIQVIIDLIYAAYEGATEAERMLRNGIEAVVEVLVDNWDIGLTYAFPDTGLSWVPVVNPEIPENQAMARLSLGVRIIPAGV